MAEIQPHGGDMTGGQRYLCVILLQLNRKKLGYSGARYCNAKMTWPHEVAGSTSYLGGWFRYLRRFAGFRADSATGSGGVRYYRAVDREQSAAVRRSVRDP